MNELLEEEKKDIYINNELLEEAKKDISHTFYFNYSCYCFYIFLIYFMIGGTFLYIIVYSSEFWMEMIFVPIFIFFIFLLLYIYYYHNKEIEIIRNIYYNRIRVVVRNKLNMRREILNISAKNGCFSYNGFIERNRLNIYNNFNDMSDLNLREINLSNKPPKFFWTFKDVSYYSWEEYRGWLKTIIGYEKYSDIKFTSKKEKQLKYFNTSNFLSFELKDYMKYYIISIAIILVIINSVIITNIEEEKDETQIGAHTYVGLCYWVIGIITTIFLVIFHHHKRRIDIFDDGLNLFIGITNFFQKYYKKKYIFNINSIDKFCFLEDGKTLSITLKQGNPQIIYKFSDNKDDLEIIKDKIQKYNK